MIAALVLSALVSVLLQGPEAGDDAARAIAAWREALELDLPAEVLGPGPAAVAPSGPLAAEGEALALVARALFDVGRQEEALALLDGARPRAGTEGWIELERARQDLERDELAAVVERLSAGGDAPRARRAGMPEAWLLLGRALTRQGRDDAAAPCLRQYVEMEPLGEGAYSALHMLSQSALARGDGAAARQLVQRAQEVGRWRAFYRVRRLQVRESPDEPLPRLGLAQLWMQARELARARAVLDDLVERCPDFAPGWFHLGEVLRAGSDWAGARAAYDSALGLDPDQPLARYNRAVLLLREGDTRGARADFEALVDGPHAEDRRVLGAHLGLARLLLAGDEHGAAEARYARYRELGGSEPLEP